MCLTAGQLPKKDPILNHRDCRFTDESSSVNRQSLFSRIYKSGLEQRVLLNQLDKILFLFCKIKRAPTDQTVNPGNVGGEGKVDDVQAGIYHGFREKGHAHTMIYHIADRNHIAYLTDHGGMEGTGGKGFIDQAAEAGIGLV